MNIRRIAHFSKLQKKSKAIRFFFNIRRRKEGRTVQGAFKAVKAMWLTENATTISQETVPVDEGDEKNEVIDMQVDTENTYLR